MRKNKLKNFALIFSILLSFIVCISFASACFEKSASESNFNSSEEKLLEVDVDYSQLTMVCLGDSITLGSGIENPYCDVVKDILGLKNVYNHGVGWSTIGYKSNCSCHPNNDFNHHPYVWRYEDLPNADIIALMGGGNDFAVCLPLGTIDDYGSTTFYGALNMLVSGLQSKFPTSYIFFMTGFDYYDFEYINRDNVNWREYNNAIKAVCVKYNIDCFDVFNEIDFDVYEYTLDEVHPTQDFVTNIWSPQIAQFIKENYK